MAAARPEALFMHCLPAHRGEEVTVRGHRIARVGRLRSGGKSAAHAEGAAADADRTSRLDRKTCALSVRYACRAAWLAHYDDDVTATLVPYPDRTLVDYLTRSRASTPTGPRCCSRARPSRTASSTRQSEAFAAALLERSAFARATASRCCFPTVRSSSSRSSASGRSAASSSPLNPTYSEREIEQALDAHACEDDRHADAVLRARQARARTVGRATRDRHVNQGVSARRFCACCSRSSRRRKKAIASRSRPEIGGWPI